MEKVFLVLGAAVVGVLLIVGIGAMLAVPVMWLWNGVLPNLFATAVFKPIDFWNAWGLLILCGLLFRSSASSDKS